MDKLDLILFVMGGYAVLNLTLMVIIWNSLNNSIDKLSVRIDKVGERIDKVESTIADLDRRVSRIEGMLSTKDCCMLKDQSQMKKAE
jgi:prefoldin subunit 5